MKSNTQRQTIMDFLKSTLKDEEVRKRVAEAAARNRREFRKVASSKDSLDYEPALDNISKYLGVRLTALKEKGMIALNGPWGVVDGLAFKLTGKFPKDPYFMSSTIRIDDANGETIALVSNDKRGLAHMISTAPLMYQLLVYLYMNKERLLKGDDKRFEQTLDALVESVGVAYKFDIRNTDSETFLSAVAEVFIPRFINKAVDAGPEALLAMLDGDTEALDVSTWVDFRVTVMDILMSLGEDFEVSFEKTVAMIQELRDTSATIQDIEEKLIKFFHIKHSAKRSVKYESVDYIPLEDINYLWNVDVDDHLESEVNAKRKATDMTAEELLIKCGVDRTEILSLSGVVLEELRKLILQEARLNKETPNQQTLIRSLARIYSSYSYYKDAFDFDVFEFEEKIKNYP